MNDVCHTYCSVACILVFVRLAPGDVVRSARVCEGGGWIFKTLFHAQRNRVISSVPAGNKYVHVLDSSVLSLLGEASKGTISF